MRPQLFMVIGMTVIAGCSTPDQTRMTGVSSHQELHQNISECQKESTGVVTESSGKKTQVCYKNAFVVCMQKRGIQGQTDLNGPGIIINRSDYIWSESYCMQPTKKK